MYLCMLRVWRLPLSVEYMNILYIDAGTAQFTGVDWLERRRWLEERGGGQANPTSAEAVEAAVQGLKNNHLTFKDRSGGGIKLEQKWSKEHRSTTI